MAHETELATVLKTASAKARVTALEKVSLRACGTGTTTVL